MSCDGFKSFSTYLCRSDFKPVKKSIHNMDLRLLYAVTLFLIAPWPLGCTAAPFPLESSTAVHEPPTATIQPRKQDSPGETNCVRGEPEPVLKNSKFIKLSKFSADEEYKLNDNITLIIRHGGCAHYLEEYQFGINNSQAIEEWRKWMFLAADLLNTLPVREIAAPQIHEMAECLRNRAKNKANYTYKTDIPIAEYESLSFDVKRFENNKARIIVAFQIIL